MAGDALMPHDPHHDVEEPDDRNEHEIRDRQMIELLNELRVALPGVQILFAFLLIVPFSNGYERITAFQTQQNTAQQELARSEQNLRSSQLNVQQQISARLLPIIGTVAQARGATVAIDRGSALFAAPALDITNEVLTQLNQQLPSVSVTPLPQQPAQQQPQGR